MITSRVDIHLLQYLWSQRLIHCLAFVSVFFCISLPVNAQDMHALRATYGRGVHAFFSGQMTQAEQLLSEAINAGSTDPRTYYFRAMVRLKLKKQFESENDMRLGASFEARNPGGRYAISKSLQRVQGRDRRILETFRRQARVERVQLIRSQTKKRYESLEKRADSLLHQDNPIKLENIALPEGAAAPLPATTTPTLSSNASPADTPTVPPVENNASDDDLDDFFSDDPASPSGQEDPFGKGSDSPQDNLFDFETSDESSPSEENNEQEFDDNPFGGPTDAPPRESKPTVASTNNSLLTDSTAPKPNTEGIFHQLGLWVGQGGATRSDRSELQHWSPAQNQAKGVAQAEFELGPAEVAIHTADNSDDDLLFASPSEETDAPEENISTSSPSAAPPDESLEDNPFEDFR